jgi:hypothetical protein
MKAPDSESVTRRHLATLVLAPAAMLGQTPASTPDELAVARQQTLRTAEQLRKIKVPIATEPSFSLRP